MTVKLIIIFKEILHILKTYLATKTVVWSSQLSVYSLSLLTESEVILVISLFIKLVLSATSIVYLTSIIHKCESVVKEWFIKHKTSIENSNTETAQNNNSKQI